MKKITLEILAKSIEDLALMTKAGFDEIHAELNNLVTKDEFYAELNNVAKKEELAKIGDTLAQIIMLMDAEFAANQAAHQRFEERFDIIEDRLDKIESNTRIKQTL